MQSKGIHPYPHQPPENQISFQFWCYHQREKGTPSEKRLRLALLGIAAPAETFAFYSVLHLYCPAHRQLPFSVHHA